MCTLDQFVNSLLSIFSNHFLTCILQTEKVKEYKMLENELPVPLNIIILLFIFLASFIYLYQRNCTNFPSGPWEFPFTGNATILQSRPHIRLTQLRDKYGDIFSIKIGRHKAIVVSSLESINEAFNMKEFNFSGRPAYLDTGMFDQGSCF